MKGYLTSYGYMGFLPWANRYQLFDTEREYISLYKEYMR